MTTTNQTGAAALALLLTCWSYRRPWSPQGASEPPPLPEPVREPLEGLTVAQLRKIARQEGMARLGCRGRRAELLEALA